MRKCTVILAAIIFLIIVVTTSILLVFFLSSDKGDESRKQKNILFILIDDLGFNDVSLRGNNEILTPNIDALFYSGVTLNRYYTHPLCTPTRAALLTGNYAHRIGMQSEVISIHQPWGLGMDQKLFPQYLKEAGYATHAVGKWHLGFFQKQYTPTKRGFDTFFGNYGSYIDYFDRTHEFSRGLNSSMVGYDFRSNLNVDRSDPGMYITDLLTKRTTEIIKNSTDTPFFIYLAHTAVHTANDANLLPAKEEDLALYDFIEDDDRKHYAAMLKSLDDSIGEVIDALVRSDKLKDTIIAFTTDNGGPTGKFPILKSNTASNYPLRSMKGSAWEGGIRVDSGIYAPWLPSGVIRNNYFHVSDWLPTLASLANTGIKFDRNIDGMDLSNMITSESGPYRQTIETIDQIHQTTSLIYEDFKLMNSTYTPLMGAGDVWLGSNNNADRLNSTYNEIVLKSKVASGLKNLDEQKITDIRKKLKISCNDKEITPCDIVNERCLFNITEDPCERSNLARDPAYAEKLQEILQRLDEVMTKVVPVRNKRRDPESDPKFHDGIWTWWQEDSLEV